LYGWWYLYDVSNHFILDQSSYISARGTVTHQNKYINKKPIFRRHSNPRFKKKLANLHLKRKWNFWEFKRKTVVKLLEAKFLVVNFELFKLVSKLSVAKSLSPKMCRMIAKILNNSLSLFDICFVCLKGPYAFVSS